MLRASLSIILPLPKYWNVSWYRNKMMFDILLLATLLMFSNNLSELCGKIAVLLLGIPILASLLQVLEGYL